MLGRDKVDVVATLRLQRKHKLGDFLGGAFFTRLLLRDVPVLAKHATQITHTKENCARALPTAQAILFAEVRERAGDDGMTAGAAHALFVLESIDMTVAWAGATVDEFRQRRLNPRVELAATVETHIARFEAFEAKAGIRCWQWLHG